MKTIGDFMRKHGLSISVGEQSMTPREKCYTLHADKNGYTVYVTWYEPTPDGYAMTLEYKELYRGTNEQRAAEAMERR